MYSTPPRWNPSTLYHPNSVVWHSGCYWRCEQGHTSGADQSGAPTNNPSTWTALSTTWPPESTALTSPPPYPSNTDSIPTMYTNEKAHAHGQSPFLGEYPTGSSGSETETEEKTRSRSSFPSGAFGNLSGTARLLSTKAAESLRYVTIQKEVYDSHNADAMLDELKGKRIWKVGGVGVMGYEGEGKYEERKKEVWRGWNEKGAGKDEWLKAARARTDQYAQESASVQPLLKWKLVERGGNLPDDAIPIGHEQNGAFLYACRAWWEGGLHLGKAGSHLVNNASISFGSAEHTLDIYEVLCGPSDPTLLQWRNYSHGQQAAVEGWLPVEGGREKDGQPLFIAKGEYDDGVHPGKCLLNDDHACIGWGGGELWVRPFQVLAYCSPNRR